MGAVTSKKTKYTFSGHESFACRQLWLKKGYDFVVGDNSFTSDDAVVTLGVGKNMVPSIRYWLKAFNLIDLKDILTPLAQGVFANDGWDPFLEDDASLWLLHYHLVTHNFASTYNIIFNAFRKEKIEFNKSIYTQYIQRRSEIEPALNISNNTIADDFSAFIKMYIGTDSANRDIEDSYSGLLTDLNLVNSFSKEKSDFYFIENTERDSLPDLIFLYAILANPGYGNSISMISLEQDENSPGNVFALSRAGIMNKITSLVSKYKFISFNDHAGIKELQFKTKPDPISILEEYYGA